jgi:hypothetical protein
MADDKPQIGSRVGHDLHDKLIEYADDRGISKAEAVRRLLESGFEYEEQQPRFEQLEEELLADGGVASKNEFAHLEQTVTNLQKKLDETRRKSNALNMALFAALMFVVLSEAGILTGLFVLAGGFIALFGVVVALFYSQFYGGEV